MPGALLAFAFLMASFSQAADQPSLEFNSRHVRKYVKPTLPVVARNMNLKGTVKLQTEISADGKVTSLKPLGGHPVLVEAASFAVKYWKFDPAPHPSTAVITVSFE